MFDSTVSSLSVKPAPRSAAIYPKAIDGAVRRAKWAILLFCLGIYYLVPWLRWDRGAGRPHQAVLLDLNTQRFYFFGLELWPQDIWLLMAALIAAVVGLFLVTSLIGRVWCGYACPQTIWTDLFMMVERRIQGDRNARMKRDAGPMNFDKAWRKAATHLTWMGIGFWTGGALTMYFVDAPTLVGDFWIGQASGEVYFTTALLTATTYFMAGWCQSTFCTSMCPWPRFQAAMSDEQTLSVSYRDWRGEPRGKGKARQGLLGDCVDCMSCVHVCPVGIDIRDGLQGECINCGLCMDACNHVMTKIGRKPWLISWDSIANLEAHAGSRPAQPFTVKRPRTVIYAMLLLGLAVAMICGINWRPRLALLAEHDRAPMFVPLADGGIRNGYTIHIDNKVAPTGIVRLSVEGLAGAVLSMDGQQPDATGALLLPVSEDGSATFRIFMRVPDRSAVADRQTVTMTAERLSDHAKVAVNAAFITR